MRMRITSTALAWGCVTLLVLYPVSAILVWAYLAPDSYGIMAALLAANAGTAFFVRLTFDLSDSGGHAWRAQRFLVNLIAVVSGVISASFWMADEVDQIWLQAVIISPVVAILVVLMWFVDKASKEGAKTEGE